MLGSWYATYVTWQPQLVLFVNEQTLFPVMVPVFVAGVQATGRLLDGDTLADIARWVQLLAAYDGIFIAADMILFDYVVEE